ncbi:MAG: hypothetical protein IJW79_11820 [Clostridia bacterium]|nr:hypothetical protein [Clostridia bacterium]
MKERFISVFEEILAVNIDGEVKNLLVEGGEASLDDALYALRKWALDKNFYLTELDEADDGWISEIQSRVLFDKLNRPNSLLLVKNYATENWVPHENNPHNFFCDLSLNRHYACGNDFVPSDDLPNLLFVVALNGKGKKYWTHKEKNSFATLIV